MHRLIPNLLGYLYDLLPNRNLFITMTTASSDNPNDVYDQYTPIILDEYKLVEPTQLLSLAVCKEFILCDRSRGTPETKRIHSPKEPRFKVDSYRAERSPQPQA